MSEVVIGVGASHTTLMNTRWAEVDHLDRAHAFRDALGRARRAIEGAGADVAVVIGPNHFRGIWLDLMPTFAIGVGDVLAAGEHGTPSGRQPACPDLGRSILDGVVRRGFDPAFSAALQVDHGITHAIQYILPPDLPVVPVLVNCFAPPLPPLARCAAFGAALGAAIGDHGGGLRVAVVASGGLSHQLPFPDWRNPDSDDDRFLVESWTHGRGRWEDYEVRRRSIVTAAAPKLREPFDRRVLALLGGGRLADLIDDLESTGPDLGQGALAERGGNGADEIRNWIAMAAACGWSPAHTLCYSPMPEWLTGMGVAVIDAPACPEETNRP